LANLCTPPSLNFAAVSFGSRFKAYTILFIHYSVAIARLLVLFCILAPLTVVQASGTVFCSEYEKLKKVQQKNRINRKKCLLSVELHFGSGVMCDAVLQCALFKRRVVIHHACVTHLQTVVPHPFNPVVWHLMATIKYL